VADSTVNRRFRVAFSFAGEKRDFVSDVAAILAARFSESKILYDKFHQAEFARADLAIYLSDLYRHASDLIVVIACPNYDEKHWTGMEWTAIHALLHENKSRVMLCRFDRASVKGLYETVGFLDLDGLAAHEAADRVLERLALNEGLPKDHYTRRPTGSSVSDTTDEMPRDPSASSSVPKRHLRPGLGSFRVAWLFPAAVGAVLSAVLLSLAAAMTGTARQLLIGVALITPFFVGMALSKHAQSPWWVVPLSGVLIAIVNLSELYVGGGPQVRWTSAAFWLGFIGALLVTVGYGVGTRVRLNKCARQERGRPAQAARPKREGRR
jgi:TIR domain-containing protein